ncbi:MAG: hypothetical protein EHM43_05690 [Ignavibacteriae bacterium]|nr:MAG: hypothetical protein EHM43_05690 [Ignavibacteriota bacterium]
MIRSLRSYRISLTTVAVLLLGAATVLSQGKDIHLSLNGNINLAQPSGWQLVLSEPSAGSTPFVYQTIETIGAWGLGLSVSYPVLAMLELRSGVWFDVQRYTIEHVVTSVDPNGSSTTTSKSFGSLSALTIPIEFVLRLPIVNSTSTVIVGAGAGWYLPMSSYEGANTTSITEGPEVNTFSDKTVIRLDPESTVNFTGRFGVRSMFSTTAGMEVGLLMTIYPLTDHEMEITTQLMGPLIDSVPVVHAVRQSFSQIRLYAAFDLQFGE